MFAKLPQLLLLGVLPVLSSALNIIVNNDDGWASANIREFYKALKNAGHNAWIIAPITNQSGKGGTTVFTDQANLTAPGVHNSVPAGAPSFGTDPNDSHIWYYNGTPAAVTFFALDYVVPNFWPAGTKPDLLVAGPNEGANLGPFFYTLSGTIGGTYAAVERGLPAIAFSAANGTIRGFTEVSGPNDPATLAAKLSTALVNKLANSSSTSGQVLPAGYGLSVNLPLLNSSCNQPEFVATRMTSGGALSDKAVLDAATGLFSFGNADVVDVCINGDCGLPGETDVVAENCATSVSVFTVDYDAPDSSVCDGGAQLAVFKGLSPLVGNGTGLKSSSSSSGNGSVTVGGSGQNINGSGVSIGSITAAGSKPSSSDVVSTNDAAMAKARAGGFVAVGVAGLLVL